MEMIVVLVVLAILMCIAAPSVFGYSRKAQETAAIAEAKEVVTAMIDLLSEDYQKTGSRITGDECLINNNGEEGDDHPLVIEARKLAGIVSKNKGKSDDHPEEWHGRVRGKWIRGNKDFILSHLVYEYSDDIWVVYDKGEYLVYKGETDTPPAHKPEDGKKPDPTERDAPPTYTPGSEPGHEDGKEMPTKAELTTHQETSTEASTETTTVTTTKNETSTEATTESKKDDGFFSFAAGRWGQMKADSKINPDTNKPMNPDGLNFKPGWLYGDESGLYLNIGSQYGGQDIPDDKLLADQVTKYEPSFVRIDPNLKIYTEEDYNHDRNILDTVNNMEYFSNCHFNQYKVIQFHVAYPDNSSVDVNYDVPNRKIVSPETLPAFNEPFNETFNETFTPPVNINYEKEIHTYWNPITGNDVLVKYNYKTKEKTFVNPVVVNGKSYTFDELCNESQQFRDTVNNEIANFENQIKAQEKQNEDALQQFNARKEAFNAKEAAYYATKEKCKAVNAKIQEACQILNGVNIIIRGDIIYYNGKYFLYGSYNETGRSDLRLLGFIWQGEWAQRDNDYKPDVPAVHGNFCEMTDLEGMPLDEVRNGIKSYH